LALAHPERYEYYAKKDYEELVARGVLWQINLLSLIGYYSPQVQKKTEKLIDENLVSFVGTDCHNMHHAELYEKCYIQKYWHNLVNSETLLNHTL
jgi:tyrosine-protein phosphatase YwqE